MTDYDATLQEFFSDVLLFLEKRKMVARDEVELKRIVKTIRIVDKVSENPRLYASYNMRVKDGLVEDASAFMTSPSNNSAYMIYSRVLYVMGNLWSDFDWERKEAQKVLLNARKQMQYKNSTNILKDLYFPFVNPKRYAVQKDAKTR